MAKVVILEGPDGSGKTTLAKSLVERGWEYRHEGLPPGNVSIVSHYLKILMDSLESPNNVVHDRLWLGERIYGPICRGVDLLTETGETLFDRLESSRMIQQYICIPNWETVKENHQKKTNDYVKSTDQLEQIYEGYLSYACSVKPHYMFDYTIGDSPSLVEDRWEYKHYPLPAGTIGSPTAKYLFIGDVPNHSTIDIPFFSTSGSSGYLNEAIKRAGIKEYDLALSNAYPPPLQKPIKPHDPYIIIENLPLLQHVFLMGNVAKNWWLRRTALDKNPSGRDIHVHYIKHPSYMKRFMGCNPNVMANVIKEMLNGVSN